MTQAALPLLDVSRPALALVHEIGYGEPSIPFETFHDTAERPRTTVTRYLNQLTTHRLVLRPQQGEYAIPKRATFSRLLTEPNPYHRSLLLYDDILDTRDEDPWAFACLPIRSALPMDIDRAIPVLHPDERVKDATRSRPYDEALWYGFDPDDIQPLETHHDEPINVPTLPPSLSLAFLLSSLDPRYMQASKEAAQRLNLPFEPIARKAKHLSPHHAPLNAIRPNTVVFPKWLENYWETAKTQHASHALDEFIEGNPEEPVNTDA